MSDQSDADNPRASTFRRGLSSSALILGALAVVGASLLLPRALHAIGMSPVAATSLTMITAALLIRRYALALSLYPPTFGVVAVGRDPIFVAAAVLGGGALWLTAALIARLVVSDDRNVPAQASVDPYLFTLAFILVIAPVAEEILYRGLLQGSLNRVVPAGVSVLLTTLLFAGVHPRPRDMIAAAAIGFVAGVLRQVSGSMSPPIIAHMAMNTASGLVPSAAVARLAHSQAVIPILLLLGGAIAVASVAMRLRALSILNGARPGRKK
ncbi:MAG: type II CAAX endopeptidase family protein [Candidatus Nanopelagicales bacterium]